MPIGVWYSDDLCLDVAKRLQADRAANDARFVQAGRLTGTQAEDRASCSAALVALWRHFVERTTFAIDDEVAALGVGWAQLRRDLTATAEATRRRADQAAHDQQLAIIAGAVDRMRADLGETRSYAPPRRVFCHDRTVRERAILERKAA